jgi:hypothetical protein
MAVLTLLAMGTSRVATAGVVVSVIPPSSVVQYPNAGVEFLVQMAADANNDGVADGTQDVTGYTIPVDLGPPPGTDPPVGWTVIGVDVVTGLAGIPFSSNLNPGEGDVLGSDGGSAFGLTATPVTFFRFMAAIESTAVAGQYTASIVSDGVLFAIARPGGGALSSAEVTTQSATFEIEPVPEPSSLTLLALLTALAATAGNARRRSRRR